MENISVSHATSTANRGCRGSKVRRLAKSVMKHPQRAPNYPRHSSVRPHVLHSLVEASQSVCEHSWRPRRLTVRRKGYLLQPRECKSQGFARVRCERAVRGPHSRRDRRHSAIDLHLASFRASGAAHEHGDRRHHVTDTLSAFVNAWYRERGQSVQSGVNQYLGRHLALAGG